MRNLQNAQETVSKIIIHIINHIIRKFLKEKGNNFLRCQIMNGMKNKIWVVFMEKDNAFHMKFTEKDTIIV